MTSRIRLLAIAPILLLLTACPGSFYDMQISSISTPSGTQELLISNVLIDMSRGDRPPGWQHIRQIPFDSPTISIVSGEAVVWQIDRMPAGSNCPWDAIPSQIRYGEIPACYVETVAAQPLVGGQAYSGPGGFFLYNQDGTIKPLSYRGYTARTRNCAVDFLANIIC